jgi:hypothetical protein
MAIDVVVDEVADNLEEMAEATRRINTNSVGFFLGGAIVGFAVGVYFGRRWNKEKIRAEAFAQSEEEIEQIRSEYRQKIVAASPKPSVEEIVEERGYDRPLPAPVPGLVDPDYVSAPPVVTYDGGKDKDEGWDYQKEQAARTEREPYVIHQNEFMANDTEYEQVVYTYYAEDDVLVDEGNGHPLPHADLIVGVNNLRFGHGSDDIDVVFVRNEERELEMQICRKAASYEEEFLVGQTRDPDDPEHDDDED